MKTLQSWFLSFSSLTSSDLPTGLLLHLLVLPHLLCVFILQGKSRTMPLTYTTSFPLKSGSQPGHKEGREIAQEVLKRKGRFTEENE